MPKQRSLLVILLVLLALAWFSGCTPERDAVRALGASKGTIEAEMGKHGECNPANGTVPATQICSLLGKAIAFQHTAVLALDAYCSSTDYLANHGQCLPPTDPAAKKELQTKLTVAVQDLAPIINNLKSVVNSTKTVSIKTVGGK